MNRPRTTLPADKLCTVSEVAAAMIRCWPTLPDKQIARQMIAEGIRKVHDHATCHRGRGKYLGHSPWSRRALNLLSEAGGLSRSVTAMLSHEHVVPVRTVIELMCNLGSKATPEACSRIICDFSIVAIISREEDAILRGLGLWRVMPTDWDGRDVWARYKAANIYNDIEHF